MRRKAIFIAFLVIVLLGILVGCEKQSKFPKRPDKNRSEITLDNVKIHLEVSQESRLGKKITFLLKIKNISNDDVKFEYPSAQTYDFVVQDKSGREIWRWSNDKVFALMIREGTLKAGKQLSLSVSWSQEDNAGKPVLPGKYTVLGKWTARGFERELKANFEILR